MSKYLENIISGETAICHIKIVFVDIVSYSKRKTRNQKILIGHFTEIVKKSIEITSKDCSTELKKRNRSFEEDIIIIPTGDGVAIGLPFDEPFDIHIQLSQNILKQIDEFNNSDYCNVFVSEKSYERNSFLKVRIGISEGDAIIYKDINGHYNIAGKPINMAARVMGHAPPSQIVLTKEAYEKYIEFGEDNCLKKLDTVIVKHGIELEIYQYISFAKLEKTPSVFLNKIDKEKKIVPEASRLIDFILINPGHYNRIIDQQLIKINYSFLISKHLITQRIYENIMGNNPSNFIGENLPVERVSFYDSIKFCNELSIKDGYEEVYKIANNKVILNEKVRGYRLPFEVEWEYVLGYDNIEENLIKIARYYDNSGNITYDVGSLGEEGENKHGICDLLGNVWEWCFDNYKENPPQSIVQEENNQLRVLRGGSFADFKTMFTTENAFRKKNNELTKNKFTGFRIVLQNL